MTPLAELMATLTELLEEPAAEQRRARFARLLTRALNVPCAAVVMANAGADAVAVAEREDMPAAPAAAALSTWLAGGWLCTLDLSPGTVQTVDALAHAAAFPEPLRAAAPGTFLVAALPVSPVAGWLVVGTDAATLTPEGELCRDLAALARLAVLLLRPPALPAADDALALLDALPDPIEVYDRAGHLTRVNRRHEAVFGAGRVRRGMTPEAVATALQPVLAQPEQLAAAIRRRDHAVVELTTIGAEPLTLERTVCAPDDDPRLGAIVVYRDVTRIKRVERQKDEFLSFVSHELKNPLTTIKGYSQMLHRRLSAAAGDDERAASFDFERAALEAAQIREEGDRQNRLVDQLLDASRIQIGRLKLKTEPLDLRVLVPETLERLRTALDGRTITYTAPRERQPLIVNADADRLRQVLGNLVENAARYSPPDTPIAVRLRTLPGGPRRIELTVRDHGRGIEKADLDRIFDQFFRVERDLRDRPVGLGVGLFIAREIVRQHQGRIWAESAGPGKGSVFHVELPLQSAPSPQPMTEAGPGEGTASRSS